MRILDVCPFYTPAGGGVKTYIERKLQAGPAAGHEIVVLAPGPEDSVQEVVPGGILATIAAPKFQLDNNYHYFDDEQRLHAAMTRWRPDVVEASSPWTSSAMVGRWQGNAAKALVMHSDPLSAYAYRWFNGLFSTATIDKQFDWYWRHLRRLNDRFDTVITASQDLSARLIAGGLDKTITIPMGVEPGTFSPTRRDPELRRALLEHCALPESATLLVGFGRLAPEKRWPMVIEAAMAAGAEHEVGLVLFGDGRDKTKILRATAGNPHITVMQPVRDRAKLATILASADAMVHGCEAETFGMAAAEAAASGLPMILPNRGGASDQVRAGIDHAYEACDGRSMREAIAAFLAGDRNQQQAMAVAAAAGTRVMDAHFDDLFAHYADLPGLALAA